LNEVNFNIALKSDEFNDSNIARPIIKPFYVKSLQLDVISEIFYIQETELEMADSKYDIGGFFLQEDLTIYTVPDELIKQHDYPNNSPLLKEIVFMLSPDKKIN
jgi:hypothetical protein